MSCWKVQKITAIFRAHRSTGVALNCAIIFSHWQIKLLNLFDKISKGSQLWLLDIFKSYFRNTNILLHVYIFGATYHYFKKSLICSKVVRMGRVLLQTPLDNLFSYWQLQKRQPHVKRRTEIETWLDLKKSGAVIHFIIVIILYHQNQYHYHCHWYHYRHNHYYQHHCCLLFWYLDCIVIVVVAADIISLLWIMIVTIIILIIII